MIRRHHKNELEQHSRRQIARSEAIYARLLAQWPEVRELTSQVARDERENHIRERLRSAFAQPRERWRRRAT